jgi:hypothetical protein
MSSTIISSGRETLFATRYATHAPTRMMAAVTPRISFRSPSPAFSFVLCETISGGITSWYW